MEEGDGAGEEEDEEEGCVRVIEKGGGGDGSLAWRAAAAARAIGVDSRSSSGRKEGNKARKGEEGLKIVTLFCWHSPGIFGLFGLSGFGGLLSGFRFGLSVLIYYKKKLW